MRIRFREFDPFARLRKKLIRETEVALHYGMRFPDRTPRIPTIEVGRGRFQLEFADRWWSEALGLTADG